MRMERDFPFNFESTNSDGYVAKDLSPKVRVLGKTAANPGSRVQHTSLRQFQEDVARPTNETACQLWTAQQPVRDGDNDPVAPVARIYRYAAIRSTFFLAVEAAPLGDRTPRRLY